MLSLARYAARGKVGVLVFVWQPLFVNSCDLVKKALNCFMFCK